ncbi:MAG: ABC transporter substrate-binding protein [Actinobacteria bacterium]|nr:ABC transporter substrate-binding protein [Actinomycetota bacterium]
MRASLGKVVVLVALSLVAAGCGARFPRSETGAGVRAGVSGNGVSAGEGTDTGTATGDTTAVGGATSGAAGATSSGGSSSAGGASSSGGSSSGSGGGSAAAAGSTDVGPTTGVTDTSIKIGYLLPLTGAAPVPSNFDKGANVYWNYVNGKGGINGRKVQVIIKDTQSSAQVGKDQAKALIEQDKVFAIVVLDRLENQQAIGQYLDSRHVPNIEIQTPANLDKSQTWTFGVTIDHGVQGSLIADYFVHVLQAKKVAVVYENTPALAPGKDAFAKEISKLGASVAYSQAIDGNGNDFSQEALALSRSGATAVWLYMAPTPAAKLANQADAAGYHPVWFANSISWAFDLVFTVAPKALQGARAFSPWLPLSDPRTNTYKQAYQSQTGQTPDDLGIVGWGVGEIVGAGIQTAGKQLGQNNFRAAMQNLKYAPDIWAPLSFGPGVREGANVVAVLKAGNGHWDLERDFSSSF